MSIKRVLITADTVGGVWTYALELAGVLRSRSVEVALATMGAPLDGGQRRDAGRIPGLTLFESEYKLEWMEAPWEDVDAAGEWLLALERRWAPDVVHLNQFCFGALPFQRPVLMTGHSCVLSWWRAVHGCDAPASWDRYRREVRRGLAAAAVVVAPSNAMLQALEEHYGPMRGARVIPNGRSYEDVDCVKEPFVFASGRVWDEAKNLRALVEASGGIPWPVVIAGEARAGSSLPHQVRWLGRVASDELATWMRRAAIYAAPALYEPFGLGILEAALARCALVLADIPSLREIWADAAAYVDPRKPEALGAAVRRLAECPEERTALAARARSRAAPYSVDCMACAYLDAYACAK